MEGQYYTQSFSVTGVPSSEVLDSGITSPQGEKRKIKSIMISVSDYQGNLVTLRIEREKIMEIPDYCLDTYGNNGGSNPQYATSKRIEIPVGHEIPEGQTMKIGILSGGTPVNISGAYVYEIV